MGQRLRACVFVIRAQGGGVVRVTTGTQTESTQSSDKYSINSGRTTSRGPDTSSGGNNVDSASQMTRRVRSPAMFGSRYYLPAVGVLRLLRTKTNI